MSVLGMYVCGPLACITHRGLKRAMDVQDLELGLENVVV